MTNKEITLLERMIELKITLDPYSPLNISSADIADFKEELQALRKELEDDRNI